MFGRFLPSNGWSARILAALSIASFCSRTNRRPAAIRLWVYFAIAGFTFSLVTNQRVDGQESGLELFEKRIRPLLLEKCASCHGEKKQWASLRLDSAAGLRSGGESGPIILAGKASESELIHRVRSNEEGYRMPPADAGGVLTPMEIDWLEKWIDEGAKWPEDSHGPAPDIRSLLKKHWAFLPRSKPEPPAPHAKASSAASTAASSQPPNPSSPAPSSNPIDAFIDAKLREAGLLRSPRSDGRTLLRRLSYDTRGLPPSREDLRRFQSAESSPVSSAAAYSAQVQTYLSSPEFGEHWTRLWMDVARYSDSKGYVYDREERFFFHSTLYRDWVIRAFQQDMPYDRFLELQLAADRYQSESPEDIVAMGFLTLGRRFLGVAPDIIDDRIDTIGRGLLGITVSCARCHDHKYDPVSTAEYYGLYGMFQNCDEHFIRLDETKATAEQRNGLQERKAAYQAYWSEQRSEAETRIRSRISDYLMAQCELDKYPDTTFSQITTKEDLIPAVVHRWTQFLDRAALESDPLFKPWIELSQLPEGDFETASRSLIEGWKADKIAIDPLLLAALEPPLQNLKQLADLYEKVLQEEQTHAFFDRSDSPCRIPDSYLSNIEWLWDTHTVEELWKKQKEIDKWIRQSPSQMPHVIALKENATLYEPRIFRRGNPANKGAVVSRQVPEFARIPYGNAKSDGSGRWELAKAITHPDNPLTARVWVNRVWKQYFGAGLVTTPSDFGIRAQPPSHPELLDWLANGFIDHGWSNRWLHQTILESQAYQQSSAPPSNSELHRNASQIDPENRLLWRMNPKRLSFEQMRDSMLTLSGELESSPSSGGAFDLFAADGNGNRYRTVYGIIDRQFLPTTLSAFDFANPDMHAPQRSETIIPQQALFFLNHPFIASRARAIASQHAGSVSQSGRVRQIFETILQRAPTEEESVAIESWLRATEDTPILAGGPSDAWSYGYGEVDNIGMRTKSFTKLPYTTSSHWQGGASLPDSELGWVHLTRDTIHAGNDTTHSGILRWTALEPGRISLRANARHPHEAGDGVKIYIVSSQHGILSEQVVAHREAEIAHESIEVNKGDTLDFVVELHGTLSYEDVTWVPAITLSPSTPTESVKSWDSKEDFHTGKSETLNRWEQLAQILLISNEALFID